MTTFPASKQEKILFIWLLIYFSLLLLSNLMSVLGVFSISSEFHFVFIGLNILRLGSYFLLPFAFKKRGYKITAFIMAGVMFVIGMIGQITLLVSVIDIMTRY